MTIVFCDLVDSTTLGERLDPESLRQVIAPYFGAMSEALERHGGAIEKFIGDAVMAVFGIPAVREDDALRAVRAAAEMRSALAELNERARAALGGPAPDAHRGQHRRGDRRRSLARPGLRQRRRGQRRRPPRAGRAARRDPHRRAHARAGPRTRSPWSRSPPLELKGKSEPVPPSGSSTSTSRRAAGDGAGLDLAARRPRARAAPLEAAFERAVDRRSCELVTLVGPAGIGKSRLATSSAASLDGRGHGRGRALPLLRRGPHVLAAARGRRGRSRAAPTATAPTRSQAGLARMLEDDDDAGYDRRARGRARWAGRSPPPTRRRPSGRCASCWRRPPPSARWWSSSRTSTGPSRPSSS